MLKLSETLKNNKGVALVLIGGSSASTKPDIEHFISLYSNLEKIFLLLTEDSKMEESNVCYIHINKPFKYSNSFFRGLSFLIYQVNLIRVLYRIRKFIKICFYHTGGTILFFPQLFSKLFGMVNITFDTGPTLKVLEHLINQRKSSFQRFLLYFEYYYLKIIEWVTLHLTDIIIVFSPSMIDFGDRSRYMKKIYFINLNYVDIEVFKKETTIEERPIDMLYIGHAEKIIPEFLSSLFYILQNRDLKINFLGYNEPLKEWKKEIRKIKSSPSIHFFGIKPHNEVPRYLNEAKFLILPSVTEGLPKVLLEAMACGTIPIATSVGAIPDIIRHGENGFLLSTDSPEIIASQILTFIDNTNLEEISESAVNYIKQNQTYNKIKEKYDRFLYIARAKALQKTI